jgi:translocation and assembly module TamB
MTAISAADGATYALVLSAYLSPRLLVACDFGLFDRSVDVRLHYHLGMRWTIRTETGRETGADLLFVLER